MTGVNFIDKGIKYVTLPGGIYSIDGKIIELASYSNKVQVDNFDNIRPITRNQIISYYTSNGEDVLSIDKYIEHVGYRTK